MFFSHFTSPDSCHLMHILQPVNCNIMKTHTDAFVGQLYVPTAIENKHRRDMTRLFACCKGACCAQAWEAHGPVPTLPLGRMKLCLSVTKAEVTARGRGGGTWERDLWFIWCMRLGEMLPVGLIDTDGGGCCRQTACSQHSSCLL